MDPPQICLNLIMFSNLEFENCKIIIAHLLLYDFLFELNRFLILFHFQFPQTKWLEEYTWYRPVSRQWQFSILTVTVAKSGYSLDSKWLGTYPWQSWQEHMSWNSKKLQFILWIYALVLIKTNHNSGLNWRFIWKDFLST